MLAGERPPIATTISAASSTKARKSLIPFSVTISKRCACERRHRQSSQRRSCNATLPSVGGVRGDIHPAFPATLPLFPCPSTLPLARTCDVAPSPDSRLSKPAAFSCSSITNLHVGSGPGWRSGFSNQRPALASFFLVSPPNSHNSTLLPSGNIAMLLAEGSSSSVRNQNVIHAFEPRLRLHTSER